MRWQEKIYFNAFVFTRNELKSFVSLKVFLWKRNSIDLSFFLAINIFFLHYVPLGAPYYTVF